MAAVAPTSYRASLAGLPSTVHSASAAANSATPSKAQENAAAVAAGRRRLEEFKRRKAAEKSKKTKGAAIPSDLQVRNPADVGQPNALPSKGDPLVSSVNHVESNGDVPKAALIVAGKHVPKKAPSPPEVATAVAAPREPIGVPKLSSTAQGQSWEPVRKDPFLQGLSIVGTAGDVRSAAGPSRIGVGESVHVSSGSCLGDASLQASSSGAGEANIADEANAARSGTAVSMVDAVSAPPEAVWEVLALPDFGLHSGTERSKLESSKGSGGMSYPQLSKSSSNKGIRRSAAPFNLEIRGGKSIGINSSVAPSKYVSKGESRPTMSQPGQEATSEKAGLPSNERAVFEYPASTKIDVPLENLEPNVANDLVRSVLPGPLSVVEESRRQLTDVAQSRIKPGHLWPQAPGREDQSMLEQHIEDLTQEKFSLQRSLDAARALADTLAQENSTFTDDYNSQGALVSDLRAEIERLQGELRAQGLVIKKMKADMDKAVQDSSAAVGRSRTLAGEVVALEEKVLKSRAQELKSQRVAETVGAENQSQKRQLLAMDKDRANLKTLIEALEEEKGLLQAQIRKASLDESRRPSKTSAPLLQAKVDAGTSSDDRSFGMYAAHAEDSDLPSLVSHSSVGQAQPMGFPTGKQSNSLHESAHSLPSRLGPPPGHTFQLSGTLTMPNEGRANPVASASPSTPSNLGVNLGPASSVIPLEQAATIGNINSLIKTLAEEKEALVRVLRAESLGAAQLRALNADLSRKLEAQTQSLELAVAQKMAHDANPRVDGDYAVSRMAPEYVDEGDEVVDRMLGWIVHLFPGGSRRKRLENYP